MKNRRTIIETGDKVVITDNLGNARTGTYVGYDTERPNRPCKVRMRNGKHRYVNFNGMRRLNPEGDREI